MPSNKRMVMSVPSAETQLLFDMNNNNNNPSNNHDCSSWSTIFNATEPDYFLDMGRDVLDIVASFCHPLDLCRLSLCSRELLRETEESARGVSVRLQQHLQSPVLPNNMMVEDGTAAHKSWRYTYLMVVEVALVNNETLGGVLAQIYRGKPIDKLNLYGLDMGDEGAAHLALALRVSRGHRVDSINLCRNNITDLGAQMVVDAVCQCHGEVNTLSLAQNRIGAGGARCIADLIRQSVNLKNLSLSDNPITDEGARVISCALLTSNSLATLSMRSVAVSVNAREDLRGKWGCSHKSAIWGLYL